MTVAHGSTFQATFRKAETDSVEEVDVTHAKEEQVRIDGNLARSLQVSDPRWELDVISEQHLRIDYDTGFSDQPVEYFGDTQARGSSEMTSIENSGKEVEKGARVLETIICSPTVLWVVFVSCVAIIPLNIQLELLTCVNFYLLGVSLDSWRLRCQC